MAVLAPYAVTPRYITRKTPSTMEIILISFFFFGFNRKSVCLTARSLFAHELQDNLPVPGAVIEYDQHYLLVLPQRQPLIYQRHHQRRSHQRSPHVSIRVILLPEKFMRVDQVSGDNARPHLFIVGKQPCFIFDCTDGGGRAG